MLQHSGVNWEPWGGDTNTGKFMLGYSGIFVAFRLQPIGP